MARRINQTPEKSISASIGPGSGWEASGISYLARRGVAGRAPALAQATRTGWVGLRRVGLGLGIGDRLPGLYISLPRRVLSPRLLRDGREGEGDEWNGEEGDWNNNGQLQAAPCLDMKEKKYCTRASNRSRID